MSERGIIPLKETGSFVYGTNDPVYAFVTWDDIADVWERAYNNAPECPTEGLPQEPTQTDEEAVNMLLGAVGGMLQQSLGERNTFRNSRSMGGTGLDQTEQALSDFDRCNPFNDGVDHELLNMTREMVGSYNLLG